LKKPNKILAAGLFIVGVTFFLKRSKSGLPDLWEDILLGVGLCLELLGIFTIIYDMSKLKDRKEKVFGRFRKKES
jgi:hypothetical protein